MCVHVILVIQIKKYCVAAGKTNYLQLTNLFMKLEVIFGNAQTYQDVEAGSFEQSDLVGDGQAGETRHSLGELHHLDDALGGELAELIPQPEVQLDPVV